MSELEKYILANRDELDRVEAVPEEAMWQKIRANAGQQKPSAKVGFNWKMLSIAALVLALVGWGLLFFDKQTAAPTDGGRDMFRQAPPTTPPIAPQNKANEPTQPPVAEQKKANEPEPQVTAASPKPQPPVAKRKGKKTAPGEADAPRPIASEEERRLQQMVAKRQREIGLDTLDRAAYADLLRELDELELTVEQARNDFAGQPQNERLLVTLIKYYELKIRILEQISNEINKREYHEALEKRI